ncbi:5'-3' exonuclease H3TH domain-containing protein [Acinetobacter baumannii]|uniref:5'-3' exonuclease H3TH domain-containing protein n=1 Tax=Acinetobacter baumannii TaxID=470 RepID=UPI000DE791EA|nr:5'-3' exonuclease H3TH domain-containing protein [Acinetobacter baumannii]SSI71562.1 DNA polymerase I [Acinetobacter baumannii]SSO85650.1 5''-3'' exonuclease (including N-terminal domain of PolI) [Acinetobacter baumannii]
MENLIILVDANSIGYAAQHAIKLYSGSMQTQAVFSFIKTMRELRQRYPHAGMVVLWDGRAEWRFEREPSYKSNRKCDPRMQQEHDAYKAQCPFIKRALKALGIKQMTSAIHEADDLAGILVQRFASDPNNRILLITGDRDWLQLVKPNVSWRDPRDESRFIHWANFYEKTGFKSPVAFLQGKALQGDSSDCISGVGGIGEATAIKILAEYGSVNEFWKLCDAGLKPPSKALRSLYAGNSPYTKEEWESQFIYVEDSSLTDEQNEKARNKALKAHMDAYVGQGRRLFLRNLELMQLLRPAPLQKEHLEIIKGEINPDDFTELCGELAFGSILKNVPNFMKPFYNGQ